MALLFCRGALCFASSARRIGGVDFRAQGCIERFLLRSRARRLRPLRIALDIRSICKRCAVVCPRAAGQIDARDAAAGAAVTRFLAVAAVATNSRSSPPGDRETPAPT